jgi:hypothetical protein
MRYFLKKHIHSNFASWSSSDVSVVKEVNEKQFRVSSLVGDRELCVSPEFGFSIVYLESDEYFVNKARREQHSFRYQAPKGEFKAYVDAFCLENAYTREHEWLDAQLSEYWDDSRRRETERRRAEGYVIPEWSKDIPPADYRGGFSDEVFNQPYLQTYLKGGGCHGYIGHSARKPDVDKYFEERFLEKSGNPSLLAMWLTSTGGRHYADSLEDRSFDDQRGYIDKTVTGCVEQALGYEIAEAA